MKFDEVIIKTNTAGSEFLAGELIIKGITSFSVDDPKDFLDIIKDNSIPFDYYDESLIPEDTETVTVTVYLPQNEQGFSRREIILDVAEKMKQNADYGSVSVLFSQSDDKDWENNWKEYFHPVKIGEKFIIKPSWEDCQPEGRTVLEIDPESSFGSGRHETTKLCLELLEKEDLRGKTLLDMGCGSGILGIAACLLGVNKCVCVDIEQNAVEITKKNAKINNIDENTLAAFSGNVLEEESLLNTISAFEYDVIVSNIVADVIIAMVPLFFRLLKKGGGVILSGIISHKKDSVSAALTSGGFEITEITTENDWIGIKAKKV